MGTDILKVLAFLGGLTVVAATFLSAVTTVVVPRGVQVRLSKLVFRAVRQLFELRARATRTYEREEHTMALYAPVALVTLPLVWLAVVFVAYTPVYWALGAESWRRALYDSGSSLTTLGFAPVDGLPQHLAAFSEAALGLALLALLITYLPSIYAAFARREALVTKTAMQMGTPPTPVEMLTRFGRLGGLDELEERVWQPWMDGFIDIQESHTSLGALAFFRSPKPDRSWVTAAGAVLDSASIAASTLDVPREPAGELCIRAGYLCLREVGAFYGIEYDDDPSPDDPICITRQEYDDVYDELAAGGLPLKADRDQAWRDFAGWRVNYDAVLVELAGHLKAPYAPWVSDRSAPLEAVRRGRQKRNRGGRR